MSASGYPEKFYNDARKFDSGGKANPILLPMLRAAMEEVALVEVKLAQEKLKKLITPLLQWAKHNSFSLPMKPHSSHLIGIRPPNRSSQELVRICDSLKAKGIYIAVKFGWDNNFRFTGK